MENYIKPTFFFDYENTDLKKYLQGVVSEDQTDKEKVISIYYAVRDGWKYNPYNVFQTPESYQASKIFKRDHGHCIDKSILMISLCRAIGIPARICLAKVRNHIATDKLVERLGTDELVPHGYVEVFINGKWIKCTPVFNQALCLLLNVRPLEFDGENDSVFQEFDKEGGSFMEYLKEYGNFDDVPLDYIRELMGIHYPHFF